MHDPWTWAMVRGLTMGRGGRMGGRGKRGKNWDNYNSIHNKIFKRKRKRSFKGTRAEY